MRARLLWQIFLASDRWHRMPLEVIGGGAQKRGIVVEETEAAVFYVDCQACFMPPAIRKFAASPSIRSLTS